VSGWLAPENISNPEGKNGHARGWPKYGSRAIALAEQNTTEQIIEFAHDKRRTK
jgi:hypothetical protein